MRLSPFWADVLRPAFHALAPAVQMNVAVRARNAAVGAACFAELVPQWGPLGTGTRGHAEAIAGVYVVAAIAAHLRRHAPRADRDAAALLALAGLAPLGLSGGAAMWGLALAAVFALQAGLGAWRRESVVLPPRPVEPDPLPRPDRGFLPATGRFAYSLCTVLVFWTVVTQHMKVPTGSMQPTILGDHGPGNAYGGDRLLADHTAYLVRDPRRFEIAVFHYPLRRDILFVKRVIGLPGEHVEIREGDIWVNGRIARKPPLVQESLWQELFPNREAALTAKRRDVAGAWRASEDDGWRKAGADALLVRPRGADAALAAYRDTLGVPDVRVSFVATPEDGKAAAVLRVTSRGHVTTFDVPGPDAEGGARLSGVEGEEVAAPDRLAPGALVALAVVDGLAIASIDGREVARLEMPVGGAGRNRVEIGARGGGLTLSEVRLEEDLYWSETPGGTNTFDCPPDGYVMLGDNSRNSEDSRKWRAATIEVAGRAQPYVVEESSTDMRGGLVRNVVREGGRIRFVDADGYPRDLDAKDVVREGPLEPRPYVRRADFVGRAALIFWPVPPFGSFRPRILP